MLRGLALRQGLFVVNGVLVFVLVLVLMFAVREFLRNAMDPGPVSSPDVSGVATPLLRGAAYTREEYELLVKRGLFGEAGKLSRGEKAAETPAPALDATQETALPLKLFGTALTRGPRALSAAIIEVREGSAVTATFYPDDEIIDNVFLREVRPQEVILENRRANRTESLRILWKSEPPRGMSAIAPGPMARTGAAAPAIGNRASLVTLDRAAISKKLEDEYARVASTLNVKVVNDENGRPKGITTDNIENYETARELGLKNGDVLISLNNEPVDSKERAIEVLRKYRNASLFRVGLLRDGQMQYLTYRVR